MNKDGIGVTAHVDCVLNRCERKLPRPVTRRIVAIGCDVPELGDQGSGFNVQDKGTSVSAVAIDDNEVFSIGCHEGSFDQWYVCTAYVIEVKVIITGYQIKGTIHDIDLGIEAGATKVDHQDFVGSRGVAVNHVRAGGTTVRANGIVVVNVTGGVTWVVVRQGADDSGITPVVATLTVKFRESRKKTDVAVIFGQAWDVAHFRSGSGTYESDHQHKP